MNGELFGLFVSLIFAVLVQPTNSVILEAYYYNGTNYQNFADSLLPSLESQLMLSVVLPTDLPRISFVLCTDSEMFNTTLLYSNGSRVPISPMDVRLFIYSPRSDTVRLSQSYPSLIGQFLSKNYTTILQDYYITSALTDISENSILYQFEDYSSSVECVVSYIVKPLTQGTVIQMSFTLSDELHVPSVNAEDIKKLLDWLNADNVTTRESHFLQGNNSEEKGKPSATLSYSSTTSISPSTFVSSVNSDSKIDDVEPAVQVPCETTTTIDSLPGLLLPTNNLPSPSTPPHASLPSPSSDGNSLSTIFIISICLGIFSVIIIVFGIVSFVNHVKILKEDHEYFLTYFK